MKKVTGKNAEEHYTEIDPEVDLYTAEETSHTFHIEGATREQEVELYNLLMKRS